MIEERRVPDQDELDMLREESEALAEFLHMLQHEYCQLRADFATVLQAAGGYIRVPAVDIHTIPDVSRIERFEDPITGTVTFRLKPTPSLRIGSLRSLPRPQVQGTRTRLPTREGELYAKFFAVREIASH